MSIRDNMIQQVLGNPGKYSIQQLQQAMQDGSLPAYVVVPIIQDKVQQQKQIQAAMAMQQQQPPQSTVADQVMQEAAQMGGGVDQLPSNLPESYAPGGLVAFADGGEVERYQNRGYTGTSDIERLIREIAAREGVDPDLMVRMAQTESNFNPQAVSPKGAAGVMQLMPGTAKGLGLSETDRFDPTKNVSAGIRYFKQQLNKYGSPDLAAAAYNFGPGNLDKHIKQYGGLNPDALPTETQGYLGKLGLSPRVAAALTNIVPVSSAVAAETPRAAPSSYTGPEGIAQLANAAPSVAAGMEQPISDIGYGDVVRGGGIEELRQKGSTPAGRIIAGAAGSVGDWMQDKVNRMKLLGRYSWEAGLPGYFMEQTPEELEAKQKLVRGAIRMSPEEVRAALSEPEAVKAVGRADVARIAKEQKLVGPDPETAAMASAMPGAPKETQVAAASTQQPGDIVPSPVDIMSYIEGAPEKIRAGMEDLVEKERKRLKEMSDPEYAAIEKRQAERRKGLEGQKEQNALNNALAFLSGVAGTRGHWSEALAKGGKDLLSSLVTTQAAERAAQDKFDEAEDALRLRKLADAKNDDKASKQYGKEYANLMLQGTKLQVEGAYHYNTNLISKASEENKRKTLELGRQKLDIALAQAQAGNLKARAGVMAMGNKLLQAWETTSEKRAAEASVAEKYGKDWVKLPLKSEKRLQAEAELQQAKNAWVENNMMLHAGMGTFGGEGTSGARDYYDLLAGNI